MRGACCLDGQRSTAGGRSVKPHCFIRCLKTLRRKRLWSANCQQPKLLAGSFLTPRQIRYSNWYRERIAILYQLAFNREAVLSSRMEGMNSYFAEMLLPETEIKKSRRDDWREVQNYTKAMNEAIRNLGFLPLSSRMFKQQHETLLSGERGQQAPRSISPVAELDRWFHVANAVIVPPA